LGFCVIPILTVAGFISWQYSPSLTAKDFIILVAKFKAPQPENYLVTETIVENLENATKDYSHVRIKTLDKSFEDTNTAKKEGKQKKAVIVIWGEYRKIRKDVCVDINFEIVKPPFKFPEPEAKEKTQVIAVEQPESCVLQTRLSQEMAYLSLFTQGMYRYSEEDWAKAIDLLTKALDEAKEPVSSLGKDVVYGYRGLAYYKQGNLDEAMEQWKQAVMINPDYLKKLIY
jgi:hypothetical protein